MSWKLIEHDGKSAQVYAQKLKGEIWIHLNGKTFIYEDETRPIKKKGTKSLHTGDLIAPMPGKITKILKKSNESVKRGEPIIVMEAMKMEYTLKADGDGQITAINCQLGEQVTLGKTLVHIQPQKNEVAI